MHIYTIYKATNKINGKSYIGFDSNWPGWKNNHLTTSFNNKSSNYNCIFHRAIRKYGKYGKDTFDWETISQSKERDYTLKELEPYFIKEYNTYIPNGYNMTVGGDGVLGLKFSEEHRENLSKSHIGIVAWNKGIKGSTIGWKGKRSQKYKEKLSESMKKKGIRPKNCDKTRSEEIKRKLAKYNKINSNFIKNNPNSSDKYKSKILYEDGRIESIENFKNFCLNSGINYVNLISWSRKNKIGVLVHKKYKMKILDTLLINNIKKSIYQ